MAPQLRWAGSARIRRSMRRACVRAISACRSSCLLISLESASQMRRQLFAGAVAVSPARQNDLRVNGHLCAGDAAAAIALHVGRLAAEADFRGAGVARRSRSPSARVGSVPHRARRHSFRGCRNRSSFWSQRLGPRRECRGQPSWKRQGRNAYNAMRKAFSDATRVEVRRTLGHSHRERNTGRRLFLLSMG